MRSSQGNRFMKRFDIITEADARVLSRGDTVLLARGLSVHDLGPEKPDPVDYPDVAASVADAVVHGEADAGIVIDGAGIGSAIAANKIGGIRAAMVTSA